MAKQRAGAVVVITGASSGIGKATAERFARRGATLVLAARRAEALEEVATACRAHGADVTVVPTDVRDEAAVEALASRAIEVHGGFDVWINNAGVGVFGHLEDVPVDAFRALLDTNVMGCVLGARAALRHFRARERGVLINVGSALGKFAVPYMSAYVTSKFAIVGLSSALRQETRSLSRVHVCTFLPGSVDTDIYGDSANYTGRAVGPIRPTVSVDAVARRIVRLAEHPRREVVFGLTGRLGALGARIAPALTEYLAALRAERGHFRDHGAPTKEGNVFTPERASDGATHAVRQG